MEKDEPHHLRLLMETSGDCSSPYVRVTPGFLTHLQDLEPQVARRRLSQARHRATLAGLFNNLRETVFSQSDNSASKCQVLRKAKNYIQELEQTLGTLLKMKESFNLEDGNPSSLEEVKEEYVKMYFSDLGTASPSDAMSESGSTVWYLIQEYEKNSVEEDGKPRLIQSPATSSPDLMEFERYLYFYKQTVDLLVENGIVCTEEVTLPVVSTAVSHLWQNLPEERRESILQYCSQRQNVLPDPKAACNEGSVRNSRANSQEASGSLVSTPEEILFEDAFDVAAGFLDRNETQQAMSSPGSMFAGCTSENPEDNHRLYLQITGFLKGLFFANTQFPQPFYPKTSQSTPRKQRQSPGSSSAAQHLTLPFYSDC
ncbi:stimulated by retinoic acid gene 8 protein homolog isoform X1 [Mauremys mutica]|uniref:stimulated by retinoic acid gene 8 protein homolog isoform X1 n=1 Tax=Mauremys mutica TaxID=74926 RepID=UPI001D159518|nr:stimulated by retinoic acid gene 8 protein homolog isoform X1 [Mauremys mutica]